MEVVDIGNPAYAKDLGTKSCTACEGVCRVIKYCGCLKPCDSCDEFEYEDCEACEGFGELPRTHDDEIDAATNAAEAAWEAENDR